MRPPPIVFVALLAASGCVTSPDGPGDDDDSASDSAFQTHAVVTTTDFSVGALVTVDLDTHEVQEVTAISSDPVVRVDAGLVFQINRWMFDSVRVYEPPNLQQPVIEFSTDAGSNPHDAVLCDGAIFVSRYDADSIGIYDLDTGIAVGEIDLSPWADEDGLPEASTLVRHGETVYVGLQRLIREGGVWPAAPGGGAVVEIDCVEREVVASWTTGPNVFIQDHPLQDDAFLLIEGMVMEESGAVDLDGGVRTLDTTSGTLGPLEIDEATVGGNVVAIAIDADGHGIVVTSDGTQHHILCLDPITGELQALDSTNAYIPEVGMNDRGEVWVVRRAPLDDLEAGGGLAVYDPVACEQVAWIPTTLEPFSIDFF
jgi:hypothetical protein